MRVRSLIARWLHNLRVCPIVPGMSVIHRHHGAVRHKRLAR